jgi:hypothetical protein
MTSGTSCPDAVVEKVIDKIVGFFGKRIEAAGGGNFHAKPVGFHAKPPRKIQKAQVKFMILIFALTLRLCVKPTLA